MQIFSFLSEKEEMESLTIIRKKNTDTEKWKLENWYCSNSDENWGGLGFGCILRIKPTVHAGTWEKKGGYGLL